MSGLEMSPSGNGLPVVKILVFQFWFFMIMASSLSELKGGCVQLDHGETQQVIQIPAKQCLVEETRVAGQTQTWKGWSGFT